jgi:hypothetical protein
LHRDNFLYNECVFYGGRSKENEIYTAGSTDCHSCRYWCKYLAWEIVIGKYDKKYDKKHVIGKMKIPFKNMRCFYA